MILKRLAEEEDLSIKTFLPAPFTSESTSEIIDSENNVVDYYSHGSLSNLFANFVQLDCDMTIAVGIGGCVAANLIAKGLLNTKMLVIISGVFQLVKDKRLDIGYDLSEYCPTEDALKGNISLNNHYTKLASKIANKEDEETSGSHNTNNNTERLFYAEHVKNKLDDLFHDYTDISCADIDFSNFPSTLIIHGDEGGVINTKHAKKFHEKIKGSKLVIMEGCGHMPHIHHPTKVAELIYDEFIGLKENNS